MHGLISLAGSLFLNLRTSLVLSSVLCFAVGLLLMFSFHIKRDQPVSVSNLEDALSADQWQKRVAALKQIDEKNLDVRRFQAYPRLLTSPYIAERYWLVKTLANSRDPAAYQDLTTFLNDPHLNIRSMALYALGRMGNRQAIDQVMHIMETSDDWYSQWYAYRALRSLGWKQKKLN
jgi:HEAT repeat protein